MCYPYAQFNCTKFTAAYLPPMRGAMAVTYSGCLGGELKLKEGKISQYLPRHVKMSEQAGNGVYGASQLRSEHS